MGFWGGFAGSVADDISAREQRERDEATAGKERDSKIAVHLLESPDPDVQMAGMSMLQAASQPLKRKKGLSGFVGKYEQSTDPLRPFLDLANSHARAASPTAGAAAATTTPAAPPNQPDPGQFSAPPSAGAAALPASSPTTGGPMGRPAPTSTAQSSPMALARRQVAPVFGEDNTAAGEADSTALGLPQQPAMPGSPMAQAITPGQTPPYLNPHVIAAKVSEDRGTLEPGKVTGMFWPTAATLSAARVKGDLRSQAEFLQSLGASPQDVRDTMMARMGNSTGAPSATLAGWVKLPSGENAQTFLQRDPRSNSVQRVYSSGGAMVPVPAGSVEVRPPSGAAGTSPTVTTHMTTEQAITNGIIEDDGSYRPGEYLKIVQKGDQIIVQADTRPVSPFGTQAAPTGPMVQNRDGSFTPNPAAAQPNPAVIAAKALLAAVAKDFNVVNGIPNAAQQVTTRMLGQYPSLKGLSPAQIQQLAQLDDTATPQQVQQIIAAGGPLSMSGPPGASGGPAGGGGGGALGAAGAAGANGLPSDWAQRLAAELEKTAAARPKQ